jgi:hypothetical protein
MNRSQGLRWMLIAGLLMTAATATAIAQEAPAVKVLLENDKVRAFETRYKPGDENSNVPREGRVIRALTSGTLMRTYADGKTERIEWKAGDVRYNPPITGPVPQYTTKSVGASDLVLYVVVMK